MDGSLLICYCCRWKKRKRKNFSIVVTERVRREMSDQVFAKKYENKEMTKKRDKSKDKNKTQLQIGPKIRKSSKDIFTSSIFFFRKSRRTRRGKVDLQDEKIAPKIQHSEKRKHFMPPLPPSPLKGISPTFKEDYLILSTSSTSMLTVST